MRSTIATVLLMGLLAMAGCMNPRVSDEPIYFDAAGPISVDVETFNGDVFVEANDSFEFVSVYVTRRATHGALRQDEADESLVDIGYTVDMEPGVFGEVLKVRTYTDHTEPHFQDADIRITAPTVDGVFVRTGMGQVNLIGVEGEIDVIARGNVNLHTNRALLQPVTIVSREGNISYRVRAESMGQFDGETIHGEITSKARYGEFLLEASTNHRSIRATMNDGLNRIMLRTVEGDIDIAVVESPQEVGWLAKE